MESQEHNEQFDSIVAGFDPDEASDTVSQSAIKDAKKILEDSLTDIANAAVRLAKHAESEQIRANMIKYILDTHLNDKDKKTRSAFEEILTGLHKPTKAKKLS